MSAGRPALSEIQELGAISAKVPPQIRGCASAADEDS
jgi:hypothetical protein